MSDNISETLLVPTKSYDKRRKATALTVVPFFFAVTLILSIPLVAVIMALGDNPLEMSIAVSVALTIVAELIVITSAIFIGHLRPIKEFLGFKLVKWWYPLMGLGVGVVLWAALQGIAIGTQALTGDSLESSQTSSMLAGLSGIGGILFLILVVAGLVPFVEELLFRGIIVGSLKGSSWGKTAFIPVLVSAVSFGIVHFQGASSVTDYVVMLWTGLIGGIFAWLFYKTGSIWVPVSAHIGYNLVTSIIIIIGNAG